MQTKTPIRWQGKTVGVVIGNTYYSRRRKNIHYHRLIGGYGVQEPILHRLDDTGVEYIEIYETDTGAKYRTTIRTMWRHGVPYEHGHGLQLILPLKFWDYIPAGQTTLLEL